MKESPYMHKKKNGKEKKNGQDTQIPPESVLEPILFNIFKTICNSKLNSQEVKFAKTKPFGSMKTRPSFEELGRDFTTQ